MNHTEIENDVNLKEFEPDANEIMFGQKTLPDRPLTSEEILKRKKIMLKLIDQKLKFKLIEMMHKAAEKQNNSPGIAVAHTPTVTTMNYVDSQSTSSAHISNSYQSVPNWTSFDSSQYSEGKWPSSIYPQRYDAMVDPLWDMWVSHQDYSFKHECHPYSQDWNTTNSFEQNLPCPIVNTTLNFKPATNKRIHMIEENSTITSVDATGYFRDQLGEKVSTPGVLLNKIDNTQSTKEVNRFEPPAKKQLLATEQLEQNVQTKFGINANLILINPGNINVENKSDQSVELAFNNRNQQHSEIFSFEWNEMNQLVDGIFRNEVSQLEPLSLHEQKLKNKLIIEMSVNPNSLRSECTTHHYVSYHQIEQIISTAKMILYRLNQANPQIQANFFEMRKRTIRDLKILNAGPVAVKEDENIEIIRRKIKEIIDPLLCRDDSTNFDEAKRNEMISELIRNPRKLEENEMMKKLANKIDVMRSIKNVLDEFIPVRPGRPFFLLFYLFIDVPFVVSMQHASGKLAARNVKLLQDVLVDWINSASKQMNPKPKIIESKFSKGSLVMVCANRSTFDWIVHGTSKNFKGKWKLSNLVVSIPPVKHPISKNDLKTVVLKFKDPQFLHFNHLMDDLKFDNSALLTRRWELRKPPCNKFNEATKCIYVGIDIQSLVALEEMGRVAVLGKSSVYFDISYDDNEQNFLPNHF